MRTCLRAGFIFVVLVISRGAYGQCEQPNLQAAVRSFQARGVPAIEALLRLGAEQGVCFGIEQVQLVQLTESANFGIEQATLESAIRSILGDSSSYHINVRDRVVGIQRPVLSSEPPGIFDRIIPSWQTEGGPVQDVSMSLFMRLAVELNPRIKGFAGSYRPGDRGNQVTTLSEHNRTVREVLDAIVANTSKGASWLTQVPPSKAADLRLAEDHPSWVILEYEGQQFDYAPLLRGIASRLQKYGLEPNNGTPTHTPK